MTAQTSLVRQIKSKIRGLERRLKIERIQALHKGRLRQKRGLTSLRVAFITLNESAWKLPTLLERMEQDPAFETAIVLAPMTSLAPEACKAELENARSFFADTTQSPVLTTPEDLDAFNPDIVFFSNPHPVTEPAFYSDLFPKYLCCYVPYHHEIGQYADNQAQYNRFFHNSMWKIFACHDASRQTFKSTQIIKDRNVVVTGYPACEPLMTTENQSGSVWKPQPGKKFKIIWAPHHTIDWDKLPLGNFLKYADLFVEMSKQRQSEVQWAFKPHPLLKSNLYKHADWGKERTNAFYDYWKNADCCQLEEGAYRELFLQSDAMIHDSGSFLAEYLYVDKPVLFLQNVDNISDFFNDFGIKAFAACDHARTFDDVDAFVTRLCTGQSTPNAARDTFMQNNILPYFSEAPSEKIIKHLKGYFPKLTQK